MGDPVGQRPAAVGVEDGDIIDTHRFYGEAHYGSGK